MGGRRKLILVAIALTAFGAALFMYLRPRAGASLPATKRMYVVCLACKHEFEVETSVDAQAPYKCASCDRLATYPVYFCFDTNRLFVPDLQRTEPGAPPRIKYPVISPFSRSTSVGAYDPADPRAQSAKKPTLPKWEP